MRGLLADLALRGELPGSDWGDELVRYHADDEEVHREAWHILRASPVSRDPRDAQIDALHELVMSLVDTQHALAEQNRLLGQEVRALRRNLEERSADAATAGLRARLEAIVGPLDDDDDLEGASCGETTLTQAFMDALAADDDE